jgi:hypothetical protein
MQAMAPGINPVRRLTTSSSAVGKQSLRATTRTKTTAGRHFLFIFYMPSSTQDHPALSYVKLLDRAVAPAGHAAGPAASKRSRTDAPFAESSS